MPLNPRAGPRRGARSPTREGARSVRLGSAFPRPRLQALDDWSRLRGCSPSDTSGELFISPPLRSGQRISTEAQLLPSFPMAGGGEPRARGSQVRHSPAAQGGRKACCAFAVSVEKKKSNRPGGRKQRPATFIALRKALSGEGAQRMEAAPLPAQKAARCNQAKRTGEEDNVSAFPELGKERVTHNWNFR